MKKRVKGQVSFEFIVFISLSLFLFIFFVLRTTSVIADLNDEKELNVLRDISYKVQTELYLAYEAHNGYHRSFSLPGDILSKNYIIEKSDDFLFFSTNKHVVPIKIPEYTGTIGIGGNQISKTNDIIKIE